MVVGVILGALSARWPARRRRLRGESPKEGEVQSDPIKCWWKADRTAVRVGERFGLVLTCAVIEAGPITVVPVLNQLEPGALSITPFEVVSGARGEDMVAPPWRYVQFDYSVRLLSDGFFGQDVMIPGVTVTYNLQNAGGTQGRDQTYVLPCVADADPVARAEERVRHQGRIRSDVREHRIATVPCVAGEHPRVGLVRLRGCARDLRAGARRRTLPLQERRCGSQAAGAVGARRMSRHDQRSGGRCVEDRVVAGPRASCGGRDAHRGCRRARTPGGSELRWPGRGRARWTGHRSKRMDQASARAALGVGHVEGDRQSSRQRPQDSRQQRASRLESISDALGVFSAASYGRNGKPDSSALDAAVESSKDVIRGLRTSARWPMRTAGAVMRSDSRLVDRCSVPPLQDILIALRTTWSEWTRTRWADLEFGDARTALLVFVVLLALVAARSCSSASCEADRCAARSGCPRCCRSCADRRSASCGTCR